MADRPAALRPKVAVRFTRHLRRFFPDLPEVAELDDVATVAEVVRALDALSDVVTAGDRLFFAQTLSGG